MTKEFKVDKLGFYRDASNNIVLVTSIDERIPKYPQEFGLWPVCGLMKGAHQDYCNFYQIDGYNGNRLDDNMKPLGAPYDLIEFIAPFDVWEYAKGLIK